MIKLSHVYKTYSGPVHALRDVSFEINKGEFVFLTGPSGAGKTTLFKMISAYDKPTSGQIQVGNYALDTIGSIEVPYFRRTIGVVFQDFKLLRNKTIFDNVALPLVIRGDSPTQQKERVMDTLELLGIDHKFNHFPDFVSGGEQQRVAIARAIVHNPYVLIADEPTGNLDHHRAQEIMGVLEKISDRGTTVIVATHDIYLIEKYKKKRIELADGLIKGVNP